MQMVFDRYARDGGGAHRDLATGDRVRIVRLDVPDDDWRRRWRVRVDALLRGCEGIEPLVDAGDAGPHAVFEVMRVDTVGIAGRGASAGAAARLHSALRWLASLDLSAGPCRAGRRIDDGRLRADRTLAWPIETPAERRAAMRQCTAWRRVAGPSCAERSCAGEGAAPANPDEWDLLEEFDARAGLVDVTAPAAHVLRHARRSGRVAVSCGLLPAHVPSDARERRSFVLIGAPSDPDDARAAWAAALALESGRRHYAAGAGSGALQARERAIPYAVHPRPAPPVPREDAAARRSRALLCRADAHMARRQVSVAARTAARAAQLAGGHRELRAAAVLLRARARRYAGHPEDAAALLDTQLRYDAATLVCALLVEAAEAATDRALLDRGEAFARAALRYAASAAEQARARDALDRARVWRGQAAETGHWQVRAAWIAWGAEPGWPARGGYAHAPAGRLARWECACDRLERALWEGQTAAASRVARRLAAVGGRMPPLLRARAEWLEGCVTGVEGPSSIRARRAGALGVLHTGKARVVMEMLEHLSSLLTMCQQAGEDTKLLASAAARSREVLGAGSVAIYAAGRALPVAGDGRGWNVASAVAARCGAAVQTCGPDAGEAGLVACTSVRSINHPIGALAAVWPAGAVVDARRVRLLLEASALAMSPVLRAWSLSADAPATPDMPEMVGMSAGISGVRDAVRRVARVPFPVLVQGESGVGKELVARAIHRLSPRAARAFRALNCAAMAEELVEAELFGHAQGAYTGAVAARAGLFEDANGGTLFLDEVSELSPRAQAKLLRVLQEGEVRRVGETVARRADVRIIAASNVALGLAVEARLFRADLLFRLDVLRVAVPPLRDRPEDIPLLCAHFWREAASRAGTAAHLSPDVVGALSRWPWPGNVRELQNVMAALAVSAPGRGRVDAGALPPHMRGAAGPRPTLLEARATFERDLVRGALARAGGKPGRAALELGVSRQGLAKLMRRLGVAG